MNWIDKIRNKKARSEFFYKSPSIKLIGVVGLTILSNILSGAFLHDIISTSGKLQWELCYTSIYFYLILALILVLFYFYKGMYKFESELLKFGDPEYLRAYVTKECMPEIVEQAKNSLKNGTLGQFFKTIDHLYKHYTSKRPDNENNNK